MIIYKLTSPSGKSYIGQTKRDLPTRWKEHCQRLDRKTALSWALQKYDPSFWSTEIVETCSDQEELDTRERYWIESLGTFRNGYNMTVGGEGGSKVHLSEEHKQRISLARKQYFESEDGMLWKQTLSDRFKETNPSVKGRVAHNKGIPHKEESKAKMSAAHKQAWADGKRNLEAVTAQAIRMGQANRGRKLSDEHKEQIRVQRTGKPHPESQKEKVRTALQKTYEVLFPDNTIQQVTNLTQFAKEHGLNQANLSTTLKFPGRKHKGYAVLRVTS